MKKELNWLGYFCAIVSIASAIAILVCTTALNTEPKPKTNYPKETVVDVNSGACDYSIFYSSEDAKIAREGTMISAYGDEMKFEYEGQEYVIKVKDVDKFIEFDKN